MKLIAQGAEAKLYQEGKILIKDRIKKNYRIKEIDDRLRKSRTKREAKILAQLKNLGLAVPGLFENAGSKLKMEFIAGKKLSDYLSLSNYKSLCREIGENIAFMHNNNLIHGDLTTSNMIFNKKVYFIDFGLSYMSQKIEDMAVDLHLLKQALESKHWKIYEKAFSEVVKEYIEKADTGKEVISRLDVVEKRGRYKSKN